MAQTHLFWPFPAEAAPCSTDPSSLPRSPHADLGGREALMLGGCWRATTENSSNCHGTSRLAVTCLRTIGQRRGTDQGMGYKKSGKRVALPGEQLFSLQLNCALINHINYAQYFSSMCKNFPHQDFLKWPETSGEGVTPESATFSDGQF